MSAITTTSASRTSTRLEVTSRDRFAFAIAATASLALTVLQLVLPAQSEPSFTRTSDYVLEVAFLVSLLDHGRGRVVTWPISARPPDRHDRHSRLRRSLGIAERARSCHALAGQESLDLVFVIALLGWFVTGIATGVALIRAGAGWLLGLAVALALPASIALGPVGPLALAFPWILAARKP